MQKPYIHEIQAIITLMTRDGNSSTDFCPTQLILLEAITQCEHKCTVNKERMGNTFLCCLIDERIIRRLGFVWLKGEKMRPQKWDGIMRIRGPGKGNYGLLTRGN
jgi:hypothetical protein